MKITIITKNYKLNKHIILPNNLKHSLLKLKKKKNKDFINFKDNLKF